MYIEIEPKKFTLNLVNGCKIYFDLTNVKVSGKDGNIRPPCDDTVRELVRILSRITNDDYTMSVETRFPSLKAA